MKYKYYTTVLKISTDYLLYHFTHLLFKVIIPPVLGTPLRYLLQNFSDVNRVEDTELIIEPIAKPEVLHVDA